MVWLIVGVTDIPNSLGLGVTVPGVNVFDGVC